MERNNKKVVITGIAGLLGSHFSKYLLDKGYEVIGIDDLSGGYYENIDSRAKFYIADLKQNGVVNKIFEVHKPDYVYHFAAYAAEGLSPFIRHYNYENNVLASMSVINACINHCVSKLIFTTSMARYGDNDLPFIETMQTKPIDSYGVAKVAVENDLKNASAQFGLRYSIAIPHNIIGTHQNIWDKYRNVIGIWIRRILAGEPILIYGDGSQRRAFSSVKNYMRPFELLMDSLDGEVVNLGADKDYSINEAASALCLVAHKHGFNPVIEYKEPRHEVHFAWCNHDKAKALLNFNDDTNLTEIFDEMFEWARQQPVRPMRQMTYEIEKQIYSYWK
jgi:UDP-glucose 4-epimerase